MIETCLGTGVVCDWRGAVSIGQTIREKVTREDGSQKKRKREGQKRRKRERDEIQRTVHQFMLAPEMLQLPTTRRGKAHTEMHLPVAGNNRQL